MQKACYYDDEDASQNLCIGSFYSDSYFAEDIMIEKLMQMIILIGIENRMILINDSRVAQENVTQN